MAGSIKDLLAVGMGDQMVVILDQPSHVDDHLIGHPAPLAAASNSGGLRSG
jgi:hypothetical protein